MTIKVRVVIPSIGRESLQQAIASAESQQGVICNLIVIDDSLSQDIKVPPSVQLIRSGGLKGPGFCRNLGILECSEEYVAFLDDDDVWFHDKCITQIKEMQRRSLDATFHKSEMNFKKIRPKLILPFDKNPLREIYGISNLLTRKYFLPFPSLIITREIACAFDFNENFREREDLELLMQIFSAGFRVEQLDLVLMNVASHPKSSITRVSFPEDKKWFLYLWKNAGVMASLVFLFGFIIRNRLFSRIVR